jgi:MFS transporter, BCD family, chlorophyll transporter
MTTLGRTGPGEGASWPRVARLAMVQASIGGVVVLMTSTLNRVMVVELALPAALPGLLVALHYALQLTRPYTGFGSDRTGRRTPWIWAGMATLGVGATGAAAATWLMAEHFWAGLVANVVAFLLIGMGVSMTGTPFLALLAEQVSPQRRGGAAALTWLTMIVGFIISTVLAGQLLDPFSLPRLVAVVGLISAIAMGLTVLATLGVERGRSPAAAAAAAQRPDFRAAVRDILADERTKRFSIFVFLSMLAFSAQDLILEPFAGRVFDMTPGETTKIAGVMNGGMLTGMLLAALFAQKFGSLRAWATGGCAVSAVALLLLAASPTIGSVPMLQGIVFLLGTSNGAFAIGAIGSMMALTTEAGDAAVGTRMGVFGAAQGVASGLGGLLGAVASDLGRAAFGTVELGYGMVFVLEAVLFAGAAVLAARSAAGAPVLQARTVQTSGDALLEVVT